MKLKSILLSAAIVVGGTLTSLNAQAQEVFHTGTRIASVLVGFGNTLYSENQTMLVPPIQLAYEYGIAGRLIDGNASIGIGAAAGYAASKYVMTNKNLGYIQTTSYGFLGARGSFHYEFIDNLDTYLGLFLGCSMSNSRVKSSVDIIEPMSSTPFRGGIYLGSRYYFLPNMAVNAELGYGITTFNIGLTFRF